LRSDEADKLDDADYLENRAWAIEIENKFLKGENENS